MWTKNDRQIEAFIKNPGGKKEISIGNSAAVRAPGGNVVFYFRSPRTGKDREMGKFPRYERGRLAAIYREIDHWREVLREGRDPIDVREADERAVRAGATTFGDLARDLMAKKRTECTNGVHLRQLQQTYDMAAKEFGGRPIGDIRLADAAALLKPVCDRGASNTAKRMAQRLAEVFDIAAALEFRSGANLFGWKNRLDAMLTKAPPKVHHAAAPWAEVPALMMRLDADGAVSSMALRFAILTAARTGEVLGATWAEIDLDGATWTIPADRMKMSIEHRVALSSAALAILRKLHALHADGFVFRGRAPKKPLAHSVLRDAFARADGAGTVHGVARSSFRDWASEHSYARDLAERALAHVIANQSEAAYHRSDLLEQRRAMMQAWSDHCVPPPVEPAAPEDIAFEAALARADALCNIAKTERAIELREVEDALVQLQAVPLQDIVHGEAMGALKFLLQFFGPDAPQRDLPLDDGGNVVRFGRRKPGA